MPPRRTARRAARTRATHGAGTTLPPLSCFRGRPRTRKRSVDMPWLLLFLAGVFENAWAIGLKYSDGFTRLWPSVGTVLAMAVRLGLLATAMRSLPLGTAYAVWVGVGAVGTVIFGVLLFDEPVNAMRAISVALIVLGLAGLKLAAP